MEVAILVHLHVVYGMRQPHWIYDVPSRASEAKAGRELSSQSSPEGFLLFFRNEPMVVVVAFVLLIALDCVRPILTSSIGWGGAFLCELRPEVSDGSGSSFMVLK